MVSLPLPPYTDDPKTLPLIKIESSSWLVAITPPTTFPARTKVSLPVEPERVEALISPLTLTKSFPLPPETEILTPV